MASILRPSIIALVMNLHHFNALNQEKQRRLVLQKGVYLTGRRTRDFTVLLFDVDGFYIEVYFYTATNTVFLIKSFEHTDPLQPYLNSIDIKALLKD